jgi:hypothetical protein
LTPPRFYGSGLCPVFLGAGEASRAPLELPGLSDVLFNAVAKEHRTQPLRMARERRGCAVFATSDFGGQAF